ncbi:ABC-type multidrug transport system ATPase subunit [Breznakia blatticola]|uniref:ABC-type multidrug transport system ATPase subunit n=1 Tax=Breznakia blatticola TaxID=1754012 RepID=A0A4R8A6J1_9FIRM|nr:ABC transporter ATP-binding protein [Breznakia blatticola]TDW26045.1 ABC-type multidrug transport system ATPase subunit [Breznakia blatticola]
MIEVKNLTKSYGSFKAAEDVNLVAKDGCITILLGPNGAGKSTTIKSIANLLKFDGEIDICGYPNSTVEAKQAFGYIPDTPVLYDLLTIDEHVDFIGSAYKVENYREVADHYITLFDLEEKRKKVAKELSKGMRQKLSMLLALVIQPKALLVDEPMVGLDPASIEETLDLFVKLKDEGCSILISTHIIDIIENIWDEAYIMDHGRIVKTASRSHMNGESLKDLFFKYTSVEVKNDEILD